MINGSFVGNGSTGPYKFLRVEEGFLGTMLLGASYIREEKCDEATNQMAAMGYELVHFIVEKRRKYLFWQVDSLLMAFRKKSASEMGQGSSSYASRLK